MTLSETVAKQLHARFPGVEGEFDAWRDGDKTFFEATLHYAENVRTFSVWRYTDLVDIDAVVMDLCEQIVGWYEKLVRLEVQAVGDPEEV